MLFDQTHHYARILEYARSDIDDILFDFTIRDAAELVQWEIFSAVRVDEALSGAPGLEIWGPYADHTGIRLARGGGSPLPCGRCVTSLVSDNIAVLYRLEEGRP